MSQTKTKLKIYVNYFIQNDSWEAISEPNLFVLPGEYTNLNDVKAKTVYECFPLRDIYSYYLRFFLDDKTQGLKGWIDFPPNATIPIYNKCHVYVKALRMPKEVKLNFQGKDAFAPKEQIREDKKNENLMFMEEEEQQNVHKEQPNNTKENAFQLNSNLFENVDRKENEHQIPKTTPKSSPNVNANIHGNNINEHKKQESKTPNMSTNNGDAFTKPSVNSFGTTDWSSVFDNLTSGTSSSSSSSTKNNKTKFDSTCK